MSANANFLSSNSTAGISLQVVTDVAQLGPDAVALLDASERRNVEWGSMWFGLQAKHLFPESACWLVLREDSECKAVWPVQSGRPAGAMSSYYTALYAPSHHSDVTVTALAELARTLRKGKLNAGVHFFSPMDPESAEFTAMEQALELAGFITKRYFRFVNWHLPCKGLSWEQYFADRKGALRNTVRRMSKKLSADSGRTEIITGGDRLQAGLAAYEQVYAASWKQTEPYPGFVRELMTLCAEQGWLRLGVAWLGDKAIAAQFWIVAHDRAEIFKVAYDEAYKAHTAGTLLTAALMEHVLEHDKVSEVDYLIGDDPYKKTWMTHRRERWGIVAYNPRSAAGVLGLARHLAGEFKRKWAAKPPVDANV